MEVWNWINWTFVSGIVDVFVVYFLVYKTLLLVQGTRAEYVLKGLLIVAGVYILSRLLGLVTINWILGNFLSSIILIIVVLFQDDLRRGLIKVGLIRAFGGDVSKALELSITEVSNAAVELSSRRVGGLIVIKRDVGLDEFTEHAVKIDATVSHQLLISVFLPTSPIHDGGVVIEGDRIVAAGAVLPLTFNPGISSDYGTRHRAAIGLSERTDALVVVISEETGSISLIREGRISKDLNEKTLYNALHRLLVFRHQRGKKKKIISKNPVVDKLVTKTQKLKAISADVEETAAKNENK